MPKLKTDQTPGYRHHKASGNAIVVLDGKVFYLGPYGCAESRAQYNILVGQWLSNGRRLHPSDTGDELTINELTALHWEHVEVYYRKNGRPTSEQTCITHAMRPLCELYGETPASAFGPLALEHVRHEFVRAGHARTSVNRNVGRVKRLFKWGSSRQLVPPTVYHGLLSLEGLKAGRSKARETEPVRPVADVLVDAIELHVAAEVWAMIELQRLTGMRSGEVCAMRGIDIDMSGPIWHYQPAEHKTQHHGHARLVELGPKAQRTILPFRTADLNAYLFSPKKAEAKRNAVRRAKRKSKMTPSQRARKPKINPEKSPADRYTTESYRRAITRGCDKAYPPPKGMEGEALKQWRKNHRWHPHQLRHLAATRIRKQFGLDAARAVLGHKTLTITEQYAEIDAALAGRVMRKIG